MRTQTQLQVDPTIIQKTPSFHTERATATTRGEELGDEGDWEGKAERGYLIGSSSSSPAKGSSSTSGVG